MDQNRGLLDKWVGGPVLLDYVSGPQNASEQTVNALYEGRLITRGPLEVKQANVTLEAYDSFGIQVRFLQPGKNAPPFFLPWGAVLRIVGYESDPDKLLETLARLLESIGIDPEKADPR